MARPERVLSPTRTGDARNRSGTVGDLLIGTTVFWVAPGELLTCAHVVFRGKPITVRVGSTSLVAEPASPLLAADDPAARRFYPQPDVALLRVPEAPEDHPCVRLSDTSPAVGDLLQLTAFAKGENAPDRVARSGASLHLETRSSWTA